MTSTLPITPQETGTLTNKKLRIPSIDLLRGLVMFIMPIDHIRDLLHIGHPNATDLHTTQAITLQI